MIIFTFFKVFLSDFACLNAEFYVILSPKLERDEDYRLYQQPQNCNY